MSLMITNGRIITAGEDFTADLFIQDEIISAIGAHLPMQADRVIDAAGLLVMPGGIDPHVHLALPTMGTISSDDYTTGTRAALFGGTTTVIDFVTQTKGHALHAALDEWRMRSDGRACGDYGFHMIVTDLNSMTKSEIAPLIRDEGITSFKVFMAYKDTLMIDDGRIVELMNEAKRHGGLVAVHATNGEMIDALKMKFCSEGKLTPLYHYFSQPEITESEATARFARLARATGAVSYVVHMSSEGALNAVRDAGRRNQKVFAETCIQYLLLDAAAYGQSMDGAKFVMSPPLRLQKDRDALWSGIDQGTVQVVATDHCPFTWEQKLAGKDDFSKIPNGGAGIEHRLELLFSEGVHKGRISPGRFVEVTSTNAAKIFGLFPRKGSIAVGSDADLILFDPDEEHVISSSTHHMNVDYSAYEGWRVKGKTKTVILRGMVAVERDELCVKPGFGRYLKRNTVSGVI
ncbi:MAG TPA: dihydropyrimidinase [Bacteroidota bacterium]|nr:dihydropyrimidinase [Bacteroidota bacterium]